jgi:peptide deformylase
MTVRPIRLIGDPVLRTACDPVTRFDDALARLVTDLLDTVQEPGRAGLAANQIGVTLAAFVYNVDGKLGYVINPVLAGSTGPADPVDPVDPVDPAGSAGSAGERDGPEACLSVPGISAIRRRATRAVVTGVDLRGDPVTVSGGGELARCLQHEADHLRGELYIDRLADEERAAVMRRLRQQITVPR